MNDINKITKRLKKELGKEVKIETLTDAFTKRGFTLLYLNSDEGIEQLEHHKLKEYAKNKKCFTFISSVKLVFVDGTLHKSDIIKLLLHELAHIELRHIGYTDYYIYDEVTAEVEADAVVYSVLNNKGKKHLAAILVIIFIMTVNFFAINFYKTGQPIKQSEEAYTPAAHEQESKFEENKDTVYITPTGKKYHREFCRYAKTDGATAIKKEEAIKNYTPCKVCNP